MSIFFYALVGVIIAFIATGYFHGVHHEVVWQIGTFEGLQGIAQVHIGHYKDTIKVYEEVKKAAIRDGVVTNEEANSAPYFGIYYDDPDKVKDSSKWRSKGGIVLPHTNAAKATDTEFYKKVNYPPQRAMMTEFPLVSQLSIFVGLFKVFPAMDEYEKKINEYFGSIIEIHDYANKKIKYIALEKTSPSGEF